MVTYSYIIKSHANNWHKLFRIILFVKLNKAFPFFERVFSVALLSPSSSNRVWAGQGEGLHKYTETIQMRAQNQDRPLPGPACLTVKTQFYQKLPFRWEKLCQRVGPGQGLHCHCVRTVMSSFVHVRRPLAPVAGCLSPFPFICNSSSLL